MVDIYTDNSYSVKITRQPRLLVAGIALSLLALAGCDRRITVKTDYDRTVSFRNYRTYALGASPGELSEIGRQTLEETLRSTLAARHLNETSSGTADLDVLCTIATEEKEIRSPQGGRVYVPSNFSRSSGWDGIAQPPATAQITYGTLVIDFVDSTTHKIVFRGTAKGRTSTAEENAVNLRYIVTRIIARFPRARG